MNHQEGNRRSLDPAGLAEGRRFLAAYKGVLMREVTSGRCGELADVIGRRAYLRMPSGLEWSAPIDTVEPAAN